MMPDKSHFFKDLPAFDEPQVLGEAIDSYKRSIEKEPENAQHYYHLGRAYHAKGKKLAAMEAYQEAIRLKKDYYPAYCGIAMIYAGIGKIKLAIKEYSRAIRINSDCI